MVYQRERTGGFLWREPDDRSTYIVLISITWDGYGKVWPLASIISQPMPTMGPTARVSGAGNDQRAFIEGCCQRTLEWQEGEGGALIEGGALEHAY